MGSPFSYAGIIGYRLASSGAEQVSLDLDRPKGPPVSKTFAAAESELILSLNGECKDGHD
jgi:hypothetical protein